MRSAYGIAFLTFGALAAAEDFAPIPPQLQHCSVRAFQAADNDIRLQPEDKQRGKTVALPQAVRDQLPQQTDWLTRNFREMKDGVAEDQAYLNKMACRDVFPLANSVALPGGLTLYAIHAYSGRGGQWLLLYVFDPATGRVTQKPALIFTKWAQKDDPLLKKPYASTTDLRGDGKPQIVIEERGHNGTVYNAAVYRYFDIGPGLELTNVLAFDARCMDPLDDNAKALYLRKLTTLNSRQTRLDLTYAPAKHKPRVEGGYVVLESDGLGHPYRVKERHPTAQSVSSHLTKNDEALISFSMEDDDEFLKTGHGLYY